ncbi:MAG: hypothetical protein ACP5NX_03175 [Candidatus Bilamarchaeaceae archaeon]
MMTGRIIKREMRLQNNRYVLVTTRETDAQARKRRAEERKGKGDGMDGCLPLQEPPRDEDKKKGSADLPFEKFWGKGL